MDRPVYLRQLAIQFVVHPVVALLGPRQCGKTTMARQFLPPDDPGYFDLEDPVGLARLSEPMTALGSLKGRVVIVYPGTREYALSEEVRACPRASLNGASFIPARP